VIGSVPEATAVSIESDPLRGRSTPSFGDKETMVGWAAAITLIISKPSHKIGD
jgi:hypothetical protein